MESEDFKNVFLTVLTERIVWKQTRTLLLHKGGLSRDGSQMPALSHRDPDGVAFVLTHRLSISC